MKMWAFFFLATLIQSSHASQAQTTLNGEVVDEPTGFSTVDDSATQTTGPDIDAEIRSESVTGSRPLNAAEQKRAENARELAEVMAGRLDTETPAGPGNVSRKVNQFQKAWETSSPEQGVYITPACSNCVYKMQTRELMVSTIQLPRIEKIAGYDLGDHSTFSAETRNDFTLAIKPLAYGVDTNLNVYTESGMVYPFYIRSLPFQSSLIPDLLVRIEDHGLVPGKFGVKTLEEIAQVIEGNVAKTVQVPEVLANFRTPEQTEEDFIRTIEFDPASLTGFDGYRVYGSSDRRLKPKIVFRDKAFTYVQWPDWDNTPQPTAYVVKDRIDTLVNTRVRGKTLIIESTADLISLKNGDSYICLQWKG